MTGPLTIVVLGLSLSSSWGNGHATTWRALLGALGRRGHDVLFLERDVPWYRDHRDLARFDGGRLEFYASLDALDGWRGAIAKADVVVVGSYVPDGIAVLDRVLDWAGGLVAFYDIDTPVTVAALATGACAYLERSQVPRLNLYLSFTGGPILDRLERDFGAPRARTLYCSVEEARYRPLEVEKRWDLAYLGTYAEDREPALEALLIEPARRLPHRRFAVAGAQYPTSIDWPVNVERIEHVPPSQHAAFYSASRLTLNVTRTEMRRAGWSPSVRLFEAAAAGAAIVSDDWPGLSSVLEPGREVLVAGATEDMILIIEHGERQSIERLAERARRRVLGAHTADHRALELEHYIAAALCPGIGSASVTNSRSAVPASAATRVAGDAFSPQTAWRRHVSESFG
jgi:spore maturation protein CgeB